MIDNTLFDNSEIFILDEPCIAELKKIASLHPLRRSRICLHRNRESCVQEMIIVAHRDSNIEAHRHPNGKAESYHVLEGALLIKIFKDGGELTSEINLAENEHPKMYRIEGGIWHQPVPLSEWVVYHEVFKGPFLKEEDVIYSNWGL